MSRLYSPGPIAYSLTAFPNVTAGGTMLIETSQDSGTTFVRHPIGVTPTVHSNGGQGSCGTILRVTSFGAVGVAVLADISSGIVRNESVLQEAVSYTTQTALATELPLFSMRLPTDSLQPEFRLVTNLSVNCTNNANAKTIRMYFGNSVDAVQEGGTLIQTQQIGSGAGALIHGSITGRTDGHSVSCTAAGAGATGWGIGATAGTVLTTGADYHGVGSVEQVLRFTYQKAVAADALSLESIIVYLY
jgi:hypothetical protein